MHKEFHGNVLFYNSYISFAFHKTGWEFGGPFIDMEIRIYKMVGFVQGQQLIRGQVQK